MGTTTKIADRFGRRIRDARNSAGLTLEALGARWPGDGLSKQAVQRWEAGTNRPNIEDLERLCRETGHDANYFVLGDTPVLSGEAISAALAFDKLDEGEKAAVRRALNMPARAPASTPKRGRRSPLERRARPKRSAVVVALSDFWGCRWGLF